MSKESTNFLWLIIRYPTRFFIFDPEALREEIKTSCYKSMNLDQEMHECPIRNADSVTHAFIDEWLEVSADENVTVLTERLGVRNKLIQTISRAVADHFCSIKEIQDIAIRLGFEKSIRLLQNTLPVDIRTRSGDLGEVLCTEYIIQKMDFRVPIKRLRWKDDRDRTMRGNDTIGFRIRNRIKQILKAESKSRAKLSLSTVEEAEEGLLKHDGRPNPSTLAFLQNRLLEAGREEEADFILNLQTEEFTVQNVRHLIFTFSGNGPKACLDKKKTFSAEPAIGRELVGIHITDHQNFIEEIYKECNNGRF